MRVYVKMDRTLCDEFARDRGRNPFTGRRIQPGGPTHTKLLRFCAQFARDRPAVPSPKREPVAKPKSNNSSDCAKFLRDPTRNPKTNRPIKAGAAVHAALVRRCGGVAPPLRSHPVAPPKQKKSPRRTAPGAQTRDMTCQKLGLRQLSGSCWFNSSLNGFVLGGRSRKILETLARADRTPGRFAGLLSCPRVVTRSHVFSYVRRVLDDRFERTPGGKYPKNHAANLATRLGHTPTRLALGTGGDPVRAMKSILKAVFEPSTYRVVESPDEVAGIADQRVLFAALCARPGMHYPFGVPIPLATGAFALDHVVMNVNFTKSGSLSGHAVVGFFCGGKAYVYDSNRMELMKFDWKRANERRDGKALWNLLSRGGFYTGTFSNAVIPYALYVRR